MKNTLYDTRKTYDELYTLLEEGHHIIVIVSYKRIYGSPRGLAYAHKHKEGYYIISGGRIRYNGYDTTKEELIKFCKDSDLEWVIPFNSELFVKKAKEKVEVLRAVKALSKSFKD